MNWLPGRLIFLVSNPRIFYYVAHIFNIDGVQLSKYARPRPPTAATTPTSHGSASASHDNLPTGTVPLYDVDSESEESDTALGRVGDDAPQDGWVNDGRWPVVKGPDNLWSATSPPPAVSPKGRYFCIYYGPPDTVGITQSQYVHTYLFVSHYVTR